MLLSTLFALAAAPALPPILPVLQGLEPVQLETKLAQPVAGSGEENALRFRQQNRLHFDSVDGDIWVRGRDYKARMGSGGLEFHPFLGSDAPRNYPLSLTLAGVQVGGRELDLGFHGVEREGEDVVVQRADLHERYHLGVDSVEQTFVLARIESPEELTLELSIATDLQAEERESGFAFVGARGGVHVTQAVVFDANGSSMDLDLDYTGSSFRLVVPRHFIEDARLPITIDPVLTTLSPDPSPFQVRGADVMSVSTLARYVVWEETFSATDHDVFLAKINALLFGGFAFVDSEGVYIDNTAADWRQPAVAYNVNAGSLLVVAERDLAGSNTQIWGRTRFVNSSFVGAQTPLASSPNVDYALPDVGGNTSANGSTLFAVAYEGPAPFDGLNIFLTMVTGQGAPMGQTTVADSQSDERHVSISKASGMGPQANQAWNLAWDRESPGGHDIWGARYAPDGTPVEAAFPIVQGPRDTEFPSASTSLQGPSVDASWLCAYIDNDGTAGTRDMRSVPLRGALVQADLDLTNQLSFDPSEDISSVDVDSDGFRYALAWNETWNNSLDLDVWMATLSPFGASLRTDEVWNLAASTSLEWRPSVSGVHSSATSGSDAFTVAWEGIQNAPGAPAFLQAAIYKAPDNPTCMTNSVCDPNANSTGYPAQLMAYGSTAVSEDVVAFTVMGLPPGQFGYMLMSSTVASVPLSQGQLCLGGPQIRFNGSVLQSTVAGAVFFEPTLAALPQGTVVLPNSTWFFQYWYRDANPQPVSNLTDAVRIDFD